MNTDSNQSPDKHIFWPQGSSFAHDTEIQAHVLVVLYFVSCVLYTFGFFIFCKKYESGDLFFYFNGLTIGNNILFVSAVC